MEIMEITMEAKEEVAVSCWWTLHPGMEDGTTLKTVEILTTSFAKTKAEELQQSFPKNQEIQHFC